MLKSSKFDNMFFSSVCLIIEASLRDVSKTICREEPAQDCIAANPQKHPPKRLILIYSGCKCILHAPRALILSC